MQMTPFTQRGRRGVPWGAIAANMAGMGARAAYNYMMRPSPPVYVYNPPTQPPPVVTAQPNRQRARGNRRGRGRGRGRGAGTASLRGIAVSGGSVVVFQDTEVLSLSTKDKPLTITFTPGNTTLPRLDYEAKKFLRYKILYVNISYITTSSMTGAGKVSFGVGAGDQEETFKTYDHSKIVKLRPSHSVASWKNATINLGNNIMPTLTLLCSTDDANGIAFTFVALSSVDNPGNFKFSYKIEFSFPQAA
uniref:Capsid protein n=1 Tax=Hemipteran tombus-related virus TaxID=2822554 RepID=A0A8A6RKP5_9TOMB|nr:hypothetical protein [Hemipteran tombus-related virus]